MIHPIIHKLSQDIEVLELHCIGDVHLGDRGCNYKSVMAEIERIAATPNAYLLLGGDICNNAIKNSVSDIYAESIKPMEQISQAVKLFEPVKGKILGAVCGNHERRSYKEDGIDMMRLVCRELDCEQYYEPDMLMMHLSFGRKSRRTAEGRRQHYIVCLAHGTRGGRKMGGKVNALTDMAEVADADLYYQNHTHSPVIVKSKFLRPSPASGGLELVERLFVNTASHLEFDGKGYAAQHMFQPGSNSNPVVFLSGTARKLWAEM